MSPATTTTDATADGTTGAVVQKAVDAAPPQDREAERAVLGAALLDADARATVLEQLTAADFLDPAHAHLFTLLTDVITPSLEPGEKPDLVTIEAASKAAGIYEELGGRAALIDLCDACPAPSNAAAYVRIVQQKSEERQARDAAIETLRTVGLEDAAVAETPTTDLGNSIRFARKAAGKALYVGEWRQWIIWKGGRWKKDEALDILTLAKKTALTIFDEAKNTDDPARQQALAKWAVRSQSRGLLLAMVDLARPDLAVSVEKLDTDPFAFNVRNGTLDLRSGQLRPHRPKDLITKRASVRFDPAATCPLWNAVIKRAMADTPALMLYLQRLLGMCLTADIGEQVLPIFFGIGANSKNTILEAISGMMGGYACEAPPDLLMMRRNPEHPTEIADLCGRRLVVASETEEGRRLRVQLVKRLTGNACLKARRMHKDFFEFERTHKMILQTNSRPIIKEQTHAIWRRIQLVPFEVVIPREEWDLDLGEKLKKEWPGILNWALAGCLAWKKGGLNPPAEVLAATDAYRVEQDPVAEFYDEHCTFGPDVIATRADLYDRYLAHAEHVKDRHPLDRAKFYERICRRPGVEPSKKRIDGRMTRFFKGIGLLRPEVPAP